MWLVFAACYAGGFDDAAAPGRVLTFASAENRLAWESPDFGSSFLVEFMIRRGLIEEGLADPESAFRRAKGLMTHGYRRYRPLQMDLHRGPLWLATQPTQGP